MKVNSEPEHLSVKLWRTVYQTYTRFKNCSDEVLGEYGLTMERYLVLMTVRYLDQPVRISDVARWLERSTNSISMIVDRMVEAGLLRRARDKGDRRVVNLSITSKAENVMEPATSAFWKLMQQTMSSLSYRDRQTFANLLKMINYKTLEYLNPGADVERMLKHDSERHDKLMERSF